jgi:hypothetical protein
MRRLAFTPTLDSLEDRVFLNGDVVQEGDFQGQYGDQTTIDTPGTGGEQAAEQSAVAASASIRTASSQRGVIIAKAASHVRPSAIGRHQMVAVHSSSPIAHAFSTGGGHHRVVGRHH